MNSASVAASNSGPWRPIAKVAVSLFLVWHLAAVVLGPLSVPNAMIPTALAPIVRPYQQAVFINHGYKFFAPDPGPSHLVRYDILMADGSHQRGQFPDRNKYWPRLLYHRHFMLSEFIGNAGPADDWDPRLPWERQPLSAWQREYAKSYGEHLLHTSGGKRVDLELVEHGIPSPQQVLEGVRLDAPSSYRSRPLGTFSEAGQ